MNKKMLKKLLLGLGVAGFLGLGSLAVAQTFDKTSGFGTNASNTTDMGVVGQGVDHGGGLITVIKNFLNWVLGLLSLIVLGLLLWGGFKMVTAAGDEAKYKEGFKILKQAAIGLAVIGLSWFIVSIIFRVIAGTTTGA